MNSSFYLLRFSAVIAFSALFYSVPEAQILHPVHWSFESKKVAEGEYDLILNAKLDKGWHVYSQFLKGDGPIPTEITFQPSTAYQLVGKAAENSAHKESGYDKLFMMDVTKFSDQVSFVQHIKATDVSKPVKGAVRFGTCDDERCLPPDEAEFSIQLPGAAKPGGSGGSGGASVSPSAVPVVTPPVQRNAPVPVGPQIGLKSASGIVTTSPRNGVLHPVQWTFENKKADNHTYDLTFKAVIEPGWHIYSQFLKGDGPIPTSFHFDKDDNATLTGAAQENSPKRREHVEQLFNNMKVVDFATEAVFMQRITVKDSAQPVTGTLEYMACNESTCLPPEEVKFEFILSTRFPGAEITESASPPSASIAGHPVAKYLFDKNMENSACNAIGSQPADDQKMGWALIFLLGFGGGLFALLTPCVFPMIPITVGYFTKGGKDRKAGLRNALVYGASIFAIYMALGLLVTLLFGSAALNELSTNAWFNIFFGALFIAFGVSFLGYFEITLPGAWSAQTDRAADRGGYAGIFFMAFTLALVSFSCTGPIIGSLLVKTASSATISAGPVAGMAGFATALALPFALFAAFPAWLQSLPKSGGWMNEVKVTLGFVEIALALKFFSIADLTTGHKIIPYEFMLAAWIICALGLTLYFLRRIHFPHDSSKRGATALRTGLAAFWAIAALYLATGFRLNTLSGAFDTPAFVSGLMPPAGHSYVFPRTCPLNLNCFHDFDEGLAYARQVGKPVLLDFTGWGCVNCRKMEDQVWGKPGVLELIRDKYVLISLYVDERKPLDQTYKSVFDGKEKHTVGQKWSDFEAMHFNRNSQPYYVLLDADLKILNTPVAYTPDVTAYHAFLQCGLDQAEREKISTKEGLSNK